MNPFTATLNAQQRSFDATTELLEKTPKLAEQVERVAEIDVGQTPTEVVYEENKLRLLHYKPDAAGIDPETTHDVPILIVYALINKPYILDLQPDRSVVRRLLEAGFDVYLIDWGEPSRLDSQLTLDDYVSRYIDNCVDVVRERSGHESINLFGYCMGGTMGVMYTSLFPEKVKNLGLMAAGLCFDDTGGVLELWGEAEFYDPERVTDTFGNVPADFLDVGFAMMDPVSNYVSKYLRLYDNVEDDEFVENFARMERWLAEGIDVAGRTYEQFIEDIYQDNKLARNEFYLGGEHVDLGEIDIPIVQVIGHYDHLIPPESSTQFNDLVPGEVTTIESRTGHIGLSVSSSSHEDLWPEVADWFAERSQSEAQDEDTVDRTESTGSEARTREMSPEAGEAVEEEAAPEELSEEAESDAHEEEASGGIESAVHEETGEKDHDEEAFEETDEAAHGEADPDAADVEDESTVTKEATQLESVHGIGPHYAEQLREAGIESADELIAADAEALADEVGVSVDRIEEWIENATDHGER